MAGIVKGENLQKAHINLYTVRICKNNILHTYNGIYSNLFTFCIYKLKALLFCNNSHLGAQKYCQRLHSKGIYCALGDVKTLIERLLAGLGRGHGVVLGLS